MNYCPLQCVSPADRIVAQAMDRCGAYAYSVAPAESVDPTVTTAYQQWIADGRHGQMSYLDRYSDIRFDPRKLLDGAASVICAAFAYRQPPGASNGFISDYALGDDYHDVLRRRLSEAAAEISAELGCHTRVCVDTAPLLERYWAARSGLGFIGRNHQLIIPGAGSYFLLGEIITTAQLSCGQPLDDQCQGCNACIKRCPARALSIDGSFDARRCLSYLTIEMRGELPDDATLCGHLYGCDECQRVCPHNVGAPTVQIPELMARSEVAEMTPERAARLSQEDFSRIFRHSAIKRTKLAGLLRNARHLL